MTVSLVHPARTTLRQNVQPNSARSLKLRTSDGYTRVIEEHSKLGSGWVIAWVRPGYAMVKNGQPGGWATICTHGTVQPVGKGAQAEQAGRIRAQWCSDCAA